MNLGCSNLTGRFWIGSLWYYRDPSEAPSVEKALTGVDFDNGLVDGFFLDDKNVSINNILLLFFLAALFLLFSKVFFWVHVNSFILKSQKTLRAVINGPASL